MGVEKRVNKERHLIDIVKKKPYLFWYIKDIECLSREVIVEAVLTRGDFDDFLELVQLLGVDEVARIFNKQTSIERSNYSRKTKNYFKLFFERHLTNV